MTFWARLVRLIVGAAADEIEERLEGESRQPNPPTLEQLRSQGAGAAQHRASREVNEFGTKGKWKGQ